MHVIDGQAGLINCASLIFYSLTIDNILNIIVLLIIAGISVMMLTGNNGILIRAVEAKEETEIQTVKEQAELTRSTLIIEKLGKNPSRSDVANAISNDSYFAGSNKNGNIITTADGKYDILVNKDLSITVAKHGTLEDYPNASIEIVTRDVSEKEIRKKGIQRNDTSSVIFAVTQKVPSKEQLQVLDETKLENMFVSAVNNKFECEYNTWDEIVNRIKEYEEYENITIENPSDNFDILSNFFGMGEWNEHYDEKTEEYIEVFIPEFEDVYEFIIETRGYIEGLEELKYICKINNVDIEKTGKEVFFEIPETGTYEIIATDENDHVLGTTTYNLQQMPSLFMVEGKNYYYYEGMSWAEWMDSRFNACASFSERWGWIAFEGMILFEYDEEDNHNVQPSELIDSSKQYGLAQY